MLRTLRTLKSHRFLLCLVAAALLLGLVMPGVAGGQDSPDPKTRRDELSNAIEGISAEEVTALNELQAITAHRQDLEAKVAALDRQIAEASQRAAAAEDEIAAIQAQVETVQRDI